MTLPFVRLDAGTELPEKTVGPLDRTDIVRYEGASVFFNPIHHDELFAQRAGFPMPISVGMLQAGVWAMWATEHLGAANVRRVRFSFREQVWPGDTLRCRGSILRRYEVDGEQRILIAGTCDRVDGGTAVTAEATFAIPTAD